MTETDTTAKGSSREDYVTKAEVAELIDQKISSLKVYVSESDITLAQENIRAIVAQAEF